MSQNNQLPVPPLKGCPICNTQEYEYGHSFASLFVETLPPDSGDFWKLAKESFRVTMGAMQKIEATPLLVCKHCRTLVIVCPKCHTYSKVLSRPDYSEIVNCPACKKGFYTCDRSKHFDLMLGKKAWEAYIGLVVIGSLSVGFLLLILWIIFRQ